MKTWQAMGLLTLVVLLAAGGYLAYVFHERNEPGVQKAQAPERPVTDDEVVQPRKMYIATLKDAKEALPRKTGVGAVRLCAGLLSLRGGAGGVFASGGRAAERAAVDDRADHDGEGAGKFANAGSDRGQAGVCGVQDAGRREEYATAIGTIKGTGRDVLRRPDVLLRRSSPAVQALASGRVAGSGRAQAEAGHERTAGGDGAGHDPAVAVVGYRESHGDLRRGRQEVVGELPEGQGDNGDSGVGMALVFTTSYVEDAKAIFHQYKRMAEGAIAQAADEQLTKALDPEMNCIAQIVKHMAGNMRSRWTDFLPLHPARDRRVVVVVARRVPVHDRAHDVEHVVGLARAVMVLDLVEQGGDVAPADRVNSRSFQAGRTWASSRRRISLAERRPLASTWRVSQLAVTTPNVSALGSNAGRPERTRSRIERA